MISRSFWKVSVPALALQFVREQETVVVMAWLSPRPENVEKLAVCVQLLVMCVE